MVNTLRLLSKILICATLVGGGALAQSTLTQIRDTVLNTDGTPFNGTVVITWNGFAGSSGTSSPLSTSARIYNGALSVLLVPTSTAAAGTFYQAAYNSNTGLVTWTETWQVPVSTTPLTLSVVRTSSSGGGGTGGTGTGGNGTGNQYATLPIAINQVTSLSADLAAINAAIAAMGAQVNSLNASSNSSTAVYIDAEAPAGVVDGVNAAFVLSKTPSPVGSLNLFRNGLLQSPGVDFTLLGTTVTFLPVSIPRNTDVVAAFYRAAGTAAASTLVDGETPGGAADGSNLAFTLTAAPVPAGSLKLFKNGVLLNQGSDYSLSGTSITFLNATAAPQSGDLMVASYRH